MIIVAGGDSFVYGSELQSEKNTFAALVSRKYEKYSCEAWPGIGNDGIARRIVAAVESYLPDKVFVLVSWTFPGRYEFKFTYDTGQRTRDWYSITPWTIAELDTIDKEFVSKDDRILAEHYKTVAKAKTTGVYDFAKSFYRHVGSGEYWEIYSTLKEIVYLQNYLKIKKIGYMFTCADNSILYNYTIDNQDMTISSLVTQILQDQDSWFWFPAGTKSSETTNPRGFYQWAVENKYPIGTTHPLEQAHIDAAKLMEEKFDELVKKSLE